MTSAPGSLPLVGHALTLWRRPIAFLDSLRTLGDVVRVDVGTWPIYFLTTPELVHQVLVTEAHDFGRGRVFERLRPLFGNGLVITDGEFHRNQRRLMQPAFHRDRVAELSQIMAKHAESMISSWTPGQTVAVDEETRDLTLSVITRALFAAELGRPAVEEVHRSLPLILEGMLIRAVVPKSLDRLPIPMNRRFDAAALRLRRVIDEVIATYRAKDTDHGDLLSLLLSGQDSDEQVRDEVISIIFAGTETTATVLAWLLHEVGVHPEVERRLHAEIDQVLDGRQVTQADLPSLPYARQILNETLRLHSPLLFTRRALAPVLLGTVTVPAGSEIAYSPYALHRDPRTFPDPLTFDPGRWAGSGTPQPDRHAFVPFGTGQHKCIGDTFATTEILIALATIAARWRLAPAPGRVVRERPAGMPQPDALPMIATPRTRAGA